MSITSGTTGWKTINNGLSEKLDWEFVSFDYSAGTVTIRCTPYIGNKTSHDINYTVVGRSDDYIVFNGQTFWFGGASAGSSVSLPAGYEGRISPARDHIFTVPINGDMSNCVIGIRRVYNGTTYNTTGTFNLPNFSNNFTKINNIWKRCVAWLKRNGIWKRCIVWKKINGSWKKGS